jgi:uncharacterized membrane protein
MSEIVMIVFPTRGTLLDASQKLQSLDYLKIRHSALLTKAEHGEVVVFEDDINPNEGAIAGGTLGSLMGALGIAQLGALLLPGVGPIIAIGAGALLGGLIGGATGGVAAGLMDMGIKDHHLAELSKHLGEDKIALVIDADGPADLRTRLQTDLQEFQPEIVQ